MVGQNRADKLSPPSRGAWIEIQMFQTVINAKPSPPSRGAWIEILSYVYRNAVICRRPPRGGRGLKSEGTFQTITVDNVAPLAGGVD